MARATRICRLARARRSSAKRYDGASTPISCQRFPDNPDVAWRQQNDLASPRRSSITVDADIPDKSIACLAQTTRRRASSMRRWASAVGLKAVTNRQARAQRADSGPRQEKLDERKLPSARPAPGRRSSRSSSPSPPKPPPHCCGEAAAGGCSTCSTHGLKICRTTPSWVTALLAERLDQLEHGASAAPAGTNCSQHGQSPTTRSVSSAVSHLPCPRRASDR